jgi:hypothetical protein
MNLFTFLLAWFAGVFRVNVDRSLTESSPGEVLKGACCFAGALFQVGAHRGMGDWYPHHQDLWLDRHRRTTWTPS